VIVAFTLQVLFHGCHNTTPWALQGCAPNRDVQLDTVHLNTHP
jgi:hypothetical protein